MRHLSSLTTEHNLVKWAKKDFNRKLTIFMWWKKNIFRAILKRVSLNDLAGGLYKILHGFKVLLYVPVITDF